MPTSIDQFKVFYEEYKNACRNKNVEFLKSMLPADIEEDQLGFIVEMSYQSTLSLDNSGIEPTIELNGNHLTVEYEGDLGDDMTNLTLDFFFHEGYWLQYDPNEPT